MSRRILASVDIGCEKVTCAIARIQDDTGMVIVGAGRANVNGSVRNGAIIDIEAAADAVDAAINEAESISSDEITEVIVSVSGDHVKGFFGRGTVAIEPDEFGAGEINRSDIDDARETAERISLPKESSVIMTLDCGFTVDGYERQNKAPISLRAEKLTSDIYVVTADRTAIENVHEVIRKAGRRVVQTFPAGVAGARAVLSEDEKEMGVIYLDIGAGTTDVAVYHSGFLAHTGVIPIGGEQITADIQSMRVPRSEAERLKLGYASAVLSKNSERKITVKTPGGRRNISLSGKVISQIVSQRVYEIFSLVLTELESNKFSTSSFPAGIVLTGGTSRLKDICRAAGSIIGLPAEIGIPEGIEVAARIIESPEFSVATGLILLQEDENNSVKRNKPLSFRNFVDNLKGILNRLR